jgi:hypothetical protein
MNNSSKLQSFHPNPPDAAGVLSWVHMGDLRMRAADEQNDLDLQAIVDEVNVVFVNSSTMAFCPAITVKGATGQLSGRSCLPPWPGALGKHLPRHDAGSVGEVEKGVEGMHKDKADISLRDLSPLFYEGAQNF